MNKLLNHDQVLELLNLQLKNHPRYEDWMKFDAIEYTTLQPLTLKYRMPTKSETSLEINEIKAIYNETVNSCINMSASN